jgi:hypothetical protein
MISSIRLTKQKPPPGVWDEEYEAVRPYLLRYAGKDRKEYGLEVIKWKQNKTYIIKPFVLRELEPKETI